MKRTFVLIVTLCLSASLFAQQDANFVRNISYVFDASRSMKVEDLNTATFKPLTDARIGYRNGTYWFKVLLKDIAKGRNLIFESKEPSIQSVLVFANDKLLGTNKLQRGNTHISFVLKNNQDVTYFLKVTFNRQVNFPLTVKEARLDKNNGNTPAFFDGIYYGLVLMVILINLTFNVSLKDPTFLYYALFLAALNISYTGFDGVIYLFFEQQQIDFYLICFHFLIQVLAAIFATHFLNLGNSFHKKNKFGVFAFCISFIFYVLFFSTGTFLFCTIGDFIGLVILVYYWLLGVLRLKKEQFALFFVIGYSFVLLFGILFLIPINFGLPFNISMSLLKIGAVFEMITLSYAITYRVKIMQEENSYFLGEIQQYMNQLSSLEEKIKQKNNPQIDNRKEKILAVSKQYNLTDRETEVLLYITLGYTNLQIAEELYISVNTIKYHTRNIYEKLDIKLRSEINAKFLVNH